MTACPHPIKLGSDQSPTSVLGWNPKDIDSLVHGGHPDDCCEIAADACLLLWDQSFGPELIWQGNKKIPNRKVGIAFMKGKGLDEVCALIGLDPIAVRDRWRCAQARFNQDGIQPDLARWHGPRKTSEPTVKSATDLTQRSGVQAP